MATAASEYLVNLAKRIAQAYATLPETKAAMLTGSAALGLSDYYSDIDMSIYYETLPSEADFEKVRQRLGGPEIVWSLGDRADGGLIYALRINGIECQIGHVTIANVERDMNSVLTAQEVITPLQKILSGMLDCLPLYGEPLIADWKAWAAAYPDQLAKAMVEQHMIFFPIWSIYKVLAKRDVSPWFYQTLVESAFNILGVLAGLNRLYFSTFQLKRTSKFIAKMHIAPPHLAERLNGLYRAEPEEAVERLRALVQETVELVEENMPDVDTTRVRRGLVREYHEWKPVE